jgi:long-chain acyl-CoA synthetase
MSVNLAALLTASAQRDPQHPALKLDDTVVTYGALDDASARVAGLLQARGIGPGDRVGVMLPNVPYFAVAYYGILRAGGVVVPMNVLLKARETGFYLSDPAARLVFAWHAFAEAAEAGAPRRARSASSSLPASSRAPGRGRARPRGGRARRRRHRRHPLHERHDGHPEGRRAHARQPAPQHGDDGRAVRFGPDTVTLGALPLFHSFGQTCGLNATLHAGGLLTLVPRFDPGKALEIIQRDRVTVFEGVPTMYAAMLNHPEADVLRHEHAADLRVGRRRAARGGPARLRGALRQQGPRGLRPQRDVARRVVHPARRRAQGGAIGIPIPGVEMKVVDDDGNDVPQGEVGEIVIRGHNVMKGYWGRDDATRETIRDGWLHSGDMARIDEDGYFFIVDRKKDLIIRGGYNVYPREVEEVLYEHPAVREAAVVGMPHPELGEEIGAAVALKDGQEATPEELQAHVKEQVAAYKYPRMVWLVDELPKGPTGKILKREIAPPANRQA